MRAVQAILAGLTLAGLALAADPGPKPGFRDLRWGSRPPRAFSQLGMKAGMALYGQLTPNEDKRVAGQDAASISYLYWENRLCRVEVTWLLDAGHGAVPASVLAREWGAPDSTSGQPSGLELWEWTSKDHRTHARLSSLRTSDNQSDLVTLLLYERQCNEAAIEAPGI
jgi:hypothetical protein